MTWQQGIEYIVLVLNIGFLFLLMKEKPLCWVLGGLASLLSILLFIDSKLYSEAILYSYYVVAAIYGWVVWGKKNKKAVQIHKWTLLHHSRTVLFALFLGGALGYFFSQFTDAEYPYFDALTTSFSFVATYMEARKILSSWVYWFLINALSIGLYHLKGLDILALQMAFFAVLCISGYLSWKKKFELVTT